MDSHAPQLVGASSASPSSKPKRAKQRRRTKRQRAMDWARSVHIPSHYPISDELWSGKRVYDPKGLRATLVELAMWTSEDSGFEVEPPLHPFTDRHGKDQPGLLRTLGIGINVHRKRISALGRLGLVIKTYQGNGNRPDKSGIQMRTSWTKYALAVQPAVESFQPKLEKSRTEVDSPMPRKHGSVDSPMPHRHGSVDSPMPHRHGSVSSPMPHRHGSVPRPLYRSTNRDQSTKQNAAAAVNSESEKTVSSAPNPVLIRLVESVVTALNDQLQISPPLEVRDVLQLMPDLTGRPLRLPSDLESHVVNEISRVQPDRIEAYVASIIGGAITRGYTKRTFTPKPQQWGFGRRPKLY